ncbi:VWA domain-containing protein [Noviherbaspirillum sp. L7-7A]|uniref:vWA domain-containing protein n=1 Tax=Noviherbaspirillum sp. L7-7A TaxID=2850560 RepID=UPI001C2CC2B4|nr:vWA domain-containing protein [Noviherbaspirillum sp. L7-7A]MBV0882075.1 VWA domain-containing protein [Noviherbaspirillum sp. L7-7A]
MSTPERPGITPVSSIPSSSEPGATPAGILPGADTATSTTEVPTEVLINESAPSAETSAGVAEPAVAAPVPQTRAKTKGVADLVFVVDVSGSMAPCIDALRGNIEIFIDSLNRGDANNAAPVRDWRGKVVGYRDIEAAESDGLPWIIDNEFVRDAGALKAQLSRLQAAGGGDEPESLLDALYKVASMEAVPKGSQTEDPNKWRYRSDAARVVIVFTDASFKETMSINEAKGGSLQDVANVIMANRVILSLFAPNFEGYDRLSQIDKSEWEVVEFEGLNPQEALQKFTSDPVNFRTTLKQLAASVSRSAETVAL